VSKWWLDLGGAPVAATPYPLTIPDIAYWYRGDVVTFAGAEGDGEKISGAPNIVDEGATGNLAQGVSANQPLWKASTSQLNNQPSIQQVIPSWLIGTIPAALSTACTFFGCGYSVTNEASGYWGYYGLTVAGANNTYHDAFSVVLGMNLRRVGGTTAVNIVPDSPTPFLYVVKPSAAGVRWYRNSLTPNNHVNASATWVATTANAKTLVWGALSNTGNRAAAGYLGEHGIVDRACDDTECEGLVNYMAERYGITLV
jgi:hypothetical protein